MRLVSASRDFGARDPWRRAQSAAPYRSSGATFDPREAWRHPDGKACAEWWLFPRTCARRPTLSRRPDRRPGGRGTPDASMVRCRSARQEVGRHAHRTQSARSAGHTPRRFPANRGIREEDGLRVVWVDR